MDALKQLFPLSFKYTKDVPNLIIGILIQIVVGLLAGALIVLAGMVTGWIPGVGGLIGWALRIVGILVEVYVVAGIVIQVLAFCKVI